MMTNATDPVDAKGEAKRERSTIEFPYMGLEDAISVAKGVHGTTGSRAIQHDQLAAALGLSPNSSGYRMRISAARLFGVIESDRSGAGTGVKLTELGQMVVDSAHEREGKAQAFMTVPLFKKIYELNRGKMLPPAAALQREMEGLGVAKKQTERARQVFQRSAEVAGFFEMDRSRLIMPAGIKSEPTADESREQKAEPATGGGGGGGVVGSDVDPIIAGLLKRLPPSGSVWPSEQRKLWLQLFEGSFQLIYREKQSEGGVE